MTARNKAAAKSTAAKQDNANEGFDHLAMHNCTVEGGRKYEKGTECECIWVGKNRYGRDVARIVIDGEPSFIDPRHLKAGSKLPKTRIAEIEAEREAEAENTIIVLGTVGPVKEKSLLIQYPGWYKGGWFAKSHTTKLGDLEDGRAFFEIPAWKVRKDHGSDALDALEGKQAEFRKLAKSEGIELPED